MKQHTVGLLILFATTQHILSKDNLYIPDQPTEIFHEHVYHVSYQDQIVNGQVIAPGRVKYAQERYEAIKKIMDLYKRPITVLDVGAAQGYYPFRLARKFTDSSFIMIEEDRYLLRLCLLNTALDNIIFLQKKASIEELNRLGECEHFDVVLALNIIHWAEEKWQEMTDALLSLGDNIIIETPPNGDKAYGQEYLGLIERYLEEKGAKIILKTPRHTESSLFANMYWLQIKKDHLIRPDWISPEVPADRYHIRSNWNQKKLIKQTEQQTHESNWKPGINLLTFKMLNGVYPLESALEKNLPNLQSQQTSFKKPLFNNFIIQGNSITTCGTQHNETAMNTTDFEEVRQCFTTLLSISPSYILNLYDKDFLITHNLMPKEKLSPYKLSILTSVYKGEKYIRGFLEDITRQTIFDQCELIMINANSPENEEPVTRKYMQKYPNNIVYKKIDYDPGVYGVWNLGIKMARADYVTNANLDDRLKYDCYETHVRYLDEHPTIDLVYSGCYLTNKPNETFEHNSSHGRVMWHTQQEFDRIKQLYNWIPYVNNHPVWRKSLHTRYGFFDERFKAVGMEFWIRATLCGNAKYKKLDGIYSLYYYNPEGISTNPNTLDKEEKKKIIEVHKHLWETYFKNIKYLA